MSKDKTTKASNAAKPPVEKTDDLGLPSDSTTTTDLDKAKDNLASAKADVAETQVRAVAGAADPLLTEGREIENTSELSAVLAASMPSLRVKRVHPHAILPQYHSAGAACFDISSLDSAHIPPGGSATVSTGLAFEVPEGFVMLVYSRSGHGFKNDVRLANCVGVIDSDYRGELRVRLANDSNRTVFAVEPGHRIAQAMLLPAHKWAIEEVGELTDTERGDNGYGSTGA